MLGVLGRGLGFWVGEWVGDWVLGLERVFGGQWDRGFESSGGRGI